MTKIKPKKLENKRPLSSSSGRQIDPSWMKIQNNVCTSSLSKPLNLNRLTYKLASFGSSAPNHFSAAVARVVDSEYSPNIPYNKLSKRIAGNFFPSGKIVLAGSKNRKACVCVLSMFLGMLKEKYKSDLFSEDVSLRNVVVTIRIPGVKVDLQRLSRDNMNSCSYDPENFPGLTLTLPHGHTPTAIIFDTGNLVLPGASNVVYAKTCADFVYDKIFPYITEKKRGKKNEKVNNETHA